MSIRFLFINVTRAPAVVVDWPWQQCRQTAPTFLQFEKKKLKSCHPLVNNTIKKRYPIFYSVYIVRLFTRRRWFNWLKFKSTFPLRLYDIGGPVVIIIAPLDSLTQKSSMGLFMSFVCGRLLSLGSVRVIVQHSTRQFFFCHLLGCFPAQVAAEFLFVSPSPFDATQIVDITSRLFPPPSTRTHTHCSSEEKLGECCASGNSIPADVIYRKDARRRPINSL